MRDGKKSDEFSMFLVGTEGTDNEQYKEYGGCANVTMLFGLDKVTRTMYNSVAGKDGCLVPGKGSSENSADLGMGVEAARRHVERRVGTKKYSSRIVVVTNGVGATLETLSGNDDEFISDCVYEFVVIGDNKAKQLAECVGGLPNSSLYSEDDMRRRILAEHRGTTMQIQKKQQLRLSPTVYFNCSIYTKTKVKNLPTHQKASALALARRSPDGSLVLDPTKCEKAKVERQHRYTLASNQDEPVEADGILEAFRYGRQLVTFDAQEERLKKFAVAADLSVTHFLPQSEVPLYIGMDDCLCITSRPGATRSRVSFGAFVRALKDMDLAAVARFVKKDGSSPTMIALVPDISSDVECFYTRTLPFDQDVRELPFDPVKAQVSKDKIELAKQLISDMDLKEGSFKCEDTLNPVIERVFQVIEARARDATCPIPPETDEIKQLYTPDPALLRSAGPTLARFREAFDLPVVETRVEPVEKKLKVESNVGIVSKSGPANVDAWFQAASEETVEQVGPLNPVEDYDAMLSRKDKDLAEPAFTGLRAQIDQFIGPAGGANYYDKAIECLAALRRGSLKSYMEREFNEYLTKLKKTCARPFWNKMVAAEITLIHGCANVETTLEQSREFLIKDEPTTQLKLVATTPQDNDDFDDFE